MKHPVIAVLAAGMLLRSADSDACSYWDNAFMHDGSHAGAAPGRVSDVGVTVKRGRGQQSSGCGSASSSSCDDIGSVSFYFRPPEDEDTPAAQLGYAVEVVRGTAPPGFADGSALRAASVADGEARIWCRWNDGDTDDQERLDFDVVIRVIDDHGNVGPDSEPVRVTHAGGGSCAIAGSIGLRRDTWAGLAPGAILIALVARRRQKAIARTVR